MRFIDFEREGFVSGIAVTAVTVSLPGRRWIRVALLRHLRRFLPQLNVQRNF